MKWNKDIRRNARMGSSKFKPHRSRLYLHPLPSPPASVSHLWSAPDLTQPILGWKQNCKQLAELNEAQIKHVSTQHSSNTTKCGEKQTKHGTKRNSMISPTPFTSPARHNNANHFIPPKHKQASHFLYWKQSIRWLMFTFAAPCGTKVAYARNWITVMSKVCKAFLAGSWQAY